MFGILFKIYIIFTSFVVYCRHYMQALNYDNCMTQRAREANEIRQINVSWSLMQTVIIFNIIKVP